MRIRTLSSGSRGNATLVAMDELVLLVDAGLGVDELERRLQRASIGPLAPHAIAVTHGHLDHARSAGVLARRRRAPVYAAPAIQTHPAIRRSKLCVSLGAGRPVEIRGPLGQGELRLEAVELPHDAAPTYAFALDGGDRRAVVLTDMGRPSRDVAERLQGAHVLVLEFNHDEHMLDTGPYPFALKQRIRGGRGHLSNSQAATMLTWLAGPNLHTLVLAHLSEHNNRPELAVESATGALERLGLGHVQVLVASQSECGPEIVL